MLTDSNTATIAASGTLSNAVSISRDVIIGLEVPTIDTAIVYLNVSMQEEGTYRRLLKADGSADWSIASGTGNKMIFIDEAAPFNFVKVETSASQTSGAVNFVFHTVS
jgi:hypothetical protein